MAGPLPSKLPDHNDHNSVNIYLDIKGYPRYNSYLIELKKDIKKYLDIAEALE